MPDVKLKGYSGVDKTYSDVPKIWVEAPESMEENRILVPFTYGEAVSKTVEELDFSSGDMAVPIDEGDLVTELTLIKPENLKPENIAKDVVIAGLRGTHEGGGGAGSALNILAASGSYIADNEGVVSVEHNLGLCPDIVLVYSKKYATGYFLSLIGYCDELADQSKLIAQEGRIYATPDIITSISENGILGEDLYGHGLISLAGPNTFQIGGSVLKHIVGGEYSWTAIGGLVKRTGIVHLFLELDGNGHLLVSGGVPAIEYLEIYVDGVYAKTVEYAHNDLVSVDISDIETAFGVHTIYAVSIGSDLEKEYPYRFCNPVTGWIMVDVSDAVAYGNCGENAKWKIDTEGALYVGGTGAIDDYAAVAEQPWRAYKDVITSIVVTEGITQTGARAFQYLASATSISLPDSLQIIGQNLVYGCTSLESLTVPSGVTSMGFYLAYGCTSLKQATIEGSIVGSYAFYQCTNLETVSIGNKVVTIELYAFHTCTALKSVTMGNSVQTINYRAFQGCSSLTSIVIPASVTLLGDNVFYGCNSLTSATFGATASWYRYTSQTATSGSLISSSSLANKSTAANYLRSTYVGYWWRRK